MILKYIEEITEQLIKNNNIISTPIDPIEISKILGVNVQPAVLESDISGLFVIKDNMAYIRYNKNEKNKKRNRFTIAHELGHFVLHKNIPLIIEKSNKERALYRDNLSTTGEEKREREANAFAASLLMPKFLIEKEISDLPEKKDIVPRLANKFNVSDDAMTFRLINLGLLEYGL